MKTCFVAITFIWLSVLYAGGQNLVLNPGFEEYSECPENPTFSSTPRDDFNNALDVWITYAGDPSYYHLCGFHGIPPDFPRTGDGFVRLSLYKLFAVPAVSFREYLHGELSEPLQKDSLYYVEFHVRPSNKPEADRISFISDYSLHFSTQPIDTIPTTDWVLNLEAHITNTNGIVTDTGWTKVSGCYQASGGEKYITIGNFLPDSLTTSYSPPGSSGDGNASLIDDVAVVPVGLQAFLPYADQKICVGDCIDIDNPLAGGYEWFFEGGEPGYSNSQSPDICYDSAGVFDIRVIVEHCAGKDTFLLENAVEVFERPEQITNTMQNHVLTQGDTITLNTCSVGNNYSWQPITGLSCTDCPSPVLTAIQSDTFSLVVSNGGVCKDTCLFFIEVGQPPVAAFNAATQTICENDCMDFFFEGTGEVNNYTWHFPGGEPATSNEQSPQGICYPAAGSYPVSLAVQNPFGIDTLFVENAVSVLPAVLTTEDTIQPIQMDFGDTLQLTACAIGNTYTWSPPDGLSCTNCPNPTLTATTTATYSVEVSNDLACAQLCQYPVSVSFKNQIYLPSAFSPNGDGTNDVFTAFGKHHQIEALKIFNRWGGMVWEAKGDQPWDGTFKGQPASEGIYVYVLIYTNTLTEELKTVTGSVTLVR